MKLSSVVISLLVLAAPMLGAPLHSRGRCRRIPTGSDLVTDALLTTVGPSPTVAQVQNPSLLSSTPTPRVPAPSATDPARESNSDNTNNNNGQGNNDNNNNNGSYGGDGNLASLLFPPGLSYSNGFTTANGVDISGVSHVALSDGALNVRSSSGLGHPVVQQSGKTAWEAFYPRGSYKPSARPLGGFGFYAAGSNAFRDATNAGAKEVVLGYSVMFENGFDFNMGGKLPGGFGGIGGAAESCSGGRQTDRSSCFSLRLMWRTNGQSELYTYLLDTEANTNAQLRVPSSHRNPDFGFSVGRGLVSFPRGQWVTVSERIKLNDIGASNGEVEVRMNGQIVIHVSGLSLRTSGESKHQGLHFQTFFGGGSPIWASSKDQRAWFADVSGAVID